jgi:hypothetical protein
MEIFLRISASSVARITGVSCQCLSQEFIFYHPSPTDEEAEEQVPHGAEPRSQ